MRADRARLLTPLLSLAAVALVLGIPELVLRAIGFRHQSGVEWRLPDQQRFAAYRSDPHLLFTLDPAQPGVNRFGFLDDEIELPKPPGVFRILFLGDSCTQQGYPDEVAARLERDGSSAIDSVSLAVAGYSSFQGRVIAERIAPAVEGDLAVVYFGWNDHWLSQGVPDSQRSSLEADIGPLDRFVRSAHQHSRLIQLLLRLRADLRRSDASAASPLRVSLDEYRSNLEAIRVRLRELGMPVVFLTAPTSHNVLGAPENLVRDGFARDTPSVIELHAAYNEVVREVARESGAPLLDLERELRRLPPDRLSRIFIADGIHFSDRGLELLGGRIARFLVDQGLVPERPSGAG